MTFLCMYIMCAELIIGNMEHINTCTHRTVWPMRSCRDLVLRNMPYGVRNRRDHGDTGTVFFSFFPSRLGLRTIYFLRGKWKTIELRGNRVTIESSCGALIQLFMKWRASAHKAISNSMFQNRRDEIDVLTLLLLIDF